MPVQHRYEFQYWSSNYIVWNCRKLGHKMTAVCTVGALERFVFSLVRTAFDCETLQIN